MRTQSWTDEELEAAVAQSNSYREVVLALGLKATSNRTMDRIRYRCNQLELDRTHFAGRAGNRKSRTDEEVFVKGFQYGSTVRRRFLALTPYECNACGLSEWLGNAITLQVEHIDGDQFNNELNNLMLLCPNCHSQTPTWRIHKS